METKEQIKEINQHISEALDGWSKVMVEADANNWSYHLEYSDRDLLNALHIFNHVAGNIAIKNGFLNEKNVVEKMNIFTTTLEDSFGFNSVELTKKVLGDGNKS